MADETSLINIGELARPATVLIEKISDISENTRTEIQNYINTFYIDKSEYTDHYGGYTFFPEEEVPYASFLATYYSTISLSILFGSNTLADSTENWILNHQNPEDGGFMDNILPGQEQHSSTIITFYAVDMISSYDPNLGALGEDVWGSPINWWLVLGLTFLAVACIIAGYFGYKKRMG